MSNTTFKLVGVLILILTVVRVTMEVSVAKPSNLAIEPTSLMIPSVTKIKKSNNRCSDSNFITYGNMKKSRHFNRLMSFVGALALADRLGRTVVLAPAEGGGVDNDIRNTYDMKKLSERYCFVDTLPKIKNLTAGCMIMKGTKTDERKCTTTANVRSKLAWNDVNGAAYQLQAMSVINIPISIYLNEMIDTDCIWAYMYPVPSIQMVVNDLVNVYKPFAAIHLRSLETSCEDRVKKKRFSKNAENQVMSQCTMPNSYISNLLSKSGLSKLYLADDKQRPAVTRSISSTFNVATYSNINAVHIDFWMLVESDYFIGNQMSTLSMNACLARRGRGKECNNFIGNQNKAVSCRK